MHCRLGGLWGVCLLVGIAKLCGWYFLQGVCWGIVCVELFWVLCLLGFEGLVVWFDFGLLGVVDFAVRCYRFVVFCGLRFGVVGFSLYGWRSGYFDLCWITCYIQFD